MDKRTIASCATALLAGIVYCVRRVTRADSNSRSSPISSQTAMSHANQRDRRTDWSDACRGKDQYDPTDAQLHGESHSLQIKTMDRRKKYGGGDFDGDVKTLYLPSDRDGLDSDGAWIEIDAEAVVDVEAIQSREWTQRDK